MRAALHFALASAGLAQAQLRFSFSRQPAVPAAPAANVGRTVRDNAQSNPSLDMFKNKYTYIVNASVGTPAQQVEMVLSPSASSSWVIDATADVFTSYSSSSSSSTYYDYGTFNSKRSSTFVPEEIDNSDGYSSSDNGEFYVSTLDGGYGYGVSFRDTLTLGGVEMTDFSMGLVNLTNKPIGVLGIGYNDSAYDTFPDRLLDKGLIKTTAYSIWLDDASASSGSILFGAVDKARYSGHLVRIDSAPSSGAYSSSGIGFTVDLYSINGTTNSSTMQSIDDNVLPMSVLVSPSDTVSNLPSALAQQIWDMVGAVYDESIGGAWIRCSAANASNFFTFALGDWSGPVITASMADLVLPNTDFLVDNAYADDMCLFGIQGSNSDYSSASFTLGNTLLRRTYSVFDLVNNEVAFASTNFGTDAEDIVAFDKYAATVPGATKVCPASGCITSSPRASSSSIGSSGSGSSGPGSDSNDGGYDDSSHPTMLSVGAVVGIAIGAAAGALLIGGIVIAAVRCRCRRRQSADEAAAAEKGTGTPSDAGLPGMVAPPQAYARDGFLAPPERRSPPAPAGHIPSIEVTPALVPEGPVPALPHSAASAQPHDEAAPAAPTREPPFISTPTGAAPEVPAAADAPGEPGKDKGKEPEQ